MKTPEDAPTLEEHLDRLENDPKYRKEHDDFNEWARTHSTKIITKRGPPLTKGQVRALKGLKMIKCEHDKGIMMGYSKNRFRELIETMRCKECGELLDYMPQYTNDGVGERIKTNSLEDTLTQWNQGTYPEEEKK